MTAPWVDVPWVSIDCETTGVNIYTDRIVELAAVSVHADGSHEVLVHAIVNPGIEIPEGAAAVHGITTERARLEGVEPELALAALADLLYTVDIHRTPVVMFNARFDLPLILMEAERHDVDVPAVFPVLDPYLVDRIADRYRKGKRQLTLVAEHYGVTFTGEAHGAVADAVASAQVMSAIVRRYPELGERSLASLYMEQVRGHERWRESFADYLRQQQGPDADVPEPGWPIPATTKGAS